MALEEFQLPYTGQEISAALSASIINTPRLWAGIINTAAATSAKTVTIVAPLKNRDLLLLTYANGNTANNVTININGTGAFQVRTPSATLPTGEAGTGKHNIGVGQQALYLIENYGMILLSSS